MFAARTSTNAFLTTLRASTALKAPVAPLAGDFQKRFASGKALRTRMVAISSIKKITRAMKLVASAKLRRCEDAMTVARNFSQGLVSTWDARTALISKPASSDAPTPAVTPANTMFLYVPITPDRGLCGSVSSSLNRMSRTRLGNVAKSGDTSLAIVVMGEKCRAGLQRAWSSHFITAVTEHSKLKRRTFKQSCVVADIIVSQPFSEGEIAYNRFINMMSFENGITPLLPLSTIVDDSRFLEGFELEGDADLLDNLYQFVLAVRLNTYFCETDMVEVSQRVNAMGNSNKSAEDMLKRLKRLYNRTRQARVTTELSEIVSGAAAVQELISGE